MSKGRGMFSSFYVPQYILSAIKIAKPMHDILPKEIGIYAMLHYIDIKGRRQLIGKSNKTLPGLGSLDHLCEGFMNGLQAQNN